MAASTAEPPKFNIRLKKRKKEIGKRIISIILFPSTCQLSMLHQNQQQQRHIYTLQTMIRLRNHSFLHQADQFEILHKQVVQMFFRNSNKLFFLLGGGTSVLLRDDNENNREELLITFS